MMQVGDMFTLTLPYRRHRWQFWKPKVIRRQYVATHEASADWSVGERTLDTETKKTQVEKVHWVRDDVIEKIARRMCARNFGCDPHDGYVNLHWVDFRHMAEEALDVINEVGP